MTLQKADEHIRIQRRNRVSKMRLRGMTLEQITEALPMGSGDMQGIINPDTKAPYSLKTIQLDVKHIEAEWQRESRADFDTHVARQFAEIQEIKQLAWSKRNGALALQALDREMKLLGTAAPIRIDIAIVSALVDALEAANLKPSEVFETMILELNAAHTD